MRFCNACVLGGLAFVVWLDACSHDSTAPTSRLSGPTTPQGPRATPPNFAPTANAGVDLSSECVANNGASITLDGTGSADRDGQVVLYEWFERGNLVATGSSPTLTLALGTHEILMRVTDNQGGTNDDLVLVTIQDTTSPVIQMSIGPSALWPPNHSMHLVSRSIGVTDACDAVPSLDVTVASDEAENGLGDGDTAPDWLVASTGSGAFDVWVRAERSGTGRGRQYTISAFAADRSGNTASRSGTVTVAHNQ